MRKSSVLITVLTTAIIFTSSSLAQRDLRLKEVDIRLMRASKRNLEAIKSLIEEGVDPKSVNEHGETILFMPAGFGNIRNGKIFGKQRG